MTHKPDVMPEGSGWALSGCPKILAKMLHKVEALARERHYKGWSTCCMCGCRNGSSEYSYKNFVWPSGLMHYIVDHNVKPSYQFITFIAREAK